MPLISLPEPDRAIVAHHAVILRDLQRLIGAQNIISDESGREVFQSDALMSSAIDERLCRPLLIVMPTSTQQVAAVMRYAWQNRIKVVPRGAGTSVTGAAVPTADSIVLCLSRMNTISDIDYFNRTVTVQAGVSGAQVNQVIAERGFGYVPDPVSAVASTLAGNLATDASGPRTLKYGTTASHVLGVTLVTIEGEVVELGGKHLDAPGCDMIGLLAGSEGQLGVITQLTLRILPKPEAARSVLLGFASVQGAGQCIAAILKAGIIPSAIEFMDRAAIEACDALTDSGYPSEAQALTIVELVGSPGEITALQTKVVEAAKVYAPNVIRVGQNEDQDTAIWKGRRELFGAIAARHEMRWLDGAIPLGRLAEVLQSIGEICSRYELSVLNIFHAGDGTLHPIMFRAKGDSPLADTAAADRWSSHDRVPGETSVEAAMGAAAEEIMRLCVEVGGALSGENGIGLEKRELLPVQFSDDDLAIQMRLKAAFDPQWQLNHSKLFPMGGRKVPGVSQSVRPAPAQSGVTASS